MKSKKDNILAIKNPELAKQWHPTKNGDLTPNDITANSNKRVWWQGECGHQWESVVYTRNKGSGCPICSGQQVLEGYNDLATANTRLAKEWHPTKNGDLTPNKVTTGSEKKVWWKCDRGHEWEEKIFNRTNGYGCPFCAGYYACSDNSLQTLNPDLAQQWHPTQNGDLTPNDVTTGSGRKVWWICEKGHEWEASIGSRTAGNGCAICGREASAQKRQNAILKEKGSLEQEYPELSKEWHPTKNKGLTPSSITAGSGKKAWWLGSCGHEWESLISERTKGANCPFCSNRKVLKGYNDLATTNPKLSKEWHPSKNEGLSPDEVVAGAGKRVWWRCEYGHDWEATIVRRNMGRGCPECRKIKARK